MLWLRLPAAMNGVEIGAMLLTGGYRLDNNVAKLCERAFENGLTIFRVEGTTWQTALSLQSFNLEVPIDDKERIEAIKDYMVQQFNKELIESLVKQLLKFIVYRHQHSVSN